MSMHYSGLSKGWYHGGRRWGKAKRRLAWEAEQERVAYARECAEEDRQWAERFKDTMRMKIAPWQDASKVPPERLAASDPEKEGF